MSVRHIIACLGVFVCFILFVLAILWGLMADKALWGIGLGLGFLVQAWFCNMIAQEFAYRDLLKASLIRQLRG